MNNVACASGVDVLMDYLEGELTPGERATVDAHVSSCPRCAAFIASYLETPRILREATAIAMPEGLEDSLLAALRAARGTSHRDE
jgi:anti-sigma factor RsiW